MKMAECKIEEENELESRVLEEVKLITDVEEVEPSKNEVQDIQGNENTVLLLHSTDKEEENESEEMQEAEGVVESESSDSFICDSEDGLSEGETNDGSNSEVNSCLYIHLYVIVICIFLLSISQ